MDKDRMLKAEIGKGYHSPETLRVIDGFAQTPQSKKAEGRHEAWKDECNVQP